jgi:hypothetical protein
MFGIDRDNRQCPIPGIGVESRSGAAEVGSALTVSDPFGCRCLNICPCLRFQIPLIKLEVRISRVQFTSPVELALRQLTPVDSVCGRQSEGHPVVRGARY